MESTGNTDDPVRENGPNQYLVDLKSAINVEELNAEKDIEFEIDPDSLQDENEKVYFDKEDVFQQLNMECLDVEDTDSGDDSLGPFAKMGKSMVDISPAQDGGVLKKILKPGKGSVVPPNFLVKVHYNGYFEYSDEPFDSSRLRGKPLSFTLGQGQALMAWDIGISTMKKGELSRFVATHKYAYGPMGCPPRIPKEATVLFEIELVGFSDPTTEVPLDDENKEEGRKPDFKVLLERAIISKEAGNDALRENRTLIALKHYLKGLNVLERANLKDEKEEKEMKAACTDLNLNVAHCYLLNKESAKAAKYARKALGLDPTSVKARYRLGKALKLLGEFEESRKHLLIAQNKLPGNADIANELRDLDAKAKKFRALETETYKKMLSLDSSTGNLEARKRDPKESVSAEVMDLTEQRMKMFVADDSLRELPLQLQMTESEVTLIKELAKRYSIKLHEERKAGLKVYKLLKS